jgi:hypothetical protein
MRWIAFAIVLCGASAAFADGPRVEVSGGYAYLSDEGKDPVLKHTHNGGYVDGDFGWEMDHGPFPMVLSLGVSASGIYQSDNDHVQESATLHPIALFQSGEGLFAAEARFAVPIRFNDDHGWFILPRIGAGIIMDYYSFDTLNHNGAFQIERTREHEGVAFGVRPTLEVGYQFDWGAVGIQASYMTAFGDFGQLGSREQEIRGGVFVRFRL